MNRFLITNTLIWATMLLALSAGCTSSEETSLKEEAILNEGEIQITRAQFEAGNMKIGSTETRRFSELVRASGTIDVPPQNRAEITAIIGGFITDIPLLIGDNVKKGELLVVLENTEYVKMQQEYLEIAEKMDYLRADFERQQKLYEEKISSEKSFLRAKSEYNQMQATLAGLEKRLSLLGISTDLVRKRQFTSRITLRAPFSGTVTRVDVSRGTYVNPSDIIMEIIDPSHKHLELIVFEKDIMELEAGQVVRFKVPESSNEEFEAKIQLIGRSIDPKSRTINVHGHLKEEDEDKFTVGMFVQAEIILGEKEWPSIEENAILGSGENTYVLRLKEESDDYLLFERLSVKTQESQNGFAPLIDYEDEDDQFLIQGGFGISVQEN